MKPHPDCGVRIAVFDKISARVVLLCWCQARVTHSYFQSYAELELFNSW